MIDLPDSFRQTILQTYGERGRVWLTDLPALVTECSRRWSLTLAGPFPLSYNYVAPGIRADGTQVVLKLGVPNPELDSEIAALRLCAGRGLVRPLDSLPERGALLLERLLPGTMLSELEDDEKATRILAGAMRAIWRPLTPEQARLFPDLARWTAAIPRYRQSHPSGNGPIPRGLFDRAEGMLSEYLASQGEVGLLHGDLHHDNVLRAGPDGWLAIDPKGVAGEREFEAGPLMYNPWQRILSWGDLKPILARRLDILSDELGGDHQRMLGWSFIEAVLSTAWSIEDRAPDWDHCLPIAETLEKLLLGTTTALPTPHR